MRVDGNGEASQNQAAGGWDSKNTDGREGEERSRYSRKMNGEKWERNAYQKENRNAEVKIGRGRGKKTGNAF